MPSKIENPFGTTALPEEWAALKKFEKDDSIRRVIVLPSFKIKNTSFSKNFMVKRCDDVVIEAESVHPAYFEYQIGCGFLVVKFDIDYHDGIMSILKKALSRGIAELPKIWFPVLKKIIQHLSSRHKIVDAKLIESIPPGNWLKSISSGTRGYLLEKGDPYNFLPYMDRFTKGTVDTSNRINELTSILSATWLNGWLAKPDDNAFLTLTGSHYLDIHFVREVSDYMHSSLTGKLILHIHGGGENIPMMLNENSMRAAKNGEFEESVLFDLIDLMNNLATTNRVALAMRFIRHLRNIMGDFSTEPIIDQPHHDVFASKKAVFYYNDSQRLKKGQIAILPSGYPLADSYLVKPGNRAKEILHGLSHNLKIPAKNGETIPSGKGNVLLVETYGMSDRWQLLSRKISMDILEKEHHISFGAQKIIERMFRENFLRPVATLQPLLRFHNRRRELPFQKIGIPK